MHQDIFMPAVSA